MYRSMKTFGKAWVKALRSGEYMQTSGTLQKAGDKSDSFCCLGVAFDMLAIKDPDKYWWQGTVAHANKTTCGSTLSDLDLPPWLKDWLDKTAKYDGRPMDHESICIRQNDAGLRFTDIADWIEKKLPK